ncbi:MAG: DinB family protein [Saprospiraceae bacterium]|nr:DinB family protein [Saprospiraceae bacterium]
MSATSHRPQPGEYHSYFQRYIDLVPEDQIIGALIHGKHEIQELFHEIPDDRWDYRYAPEKWTLKESLIHLLDTERIMAYRALRIGRHDATPLPGFEQDDYIPYVHALKRTPLSIREEWEAVRDASIHIFMYFDPEDLVFIGNASNHAMSTRALGYILAGHARHHVKVIRTKYLI